MPSPNALKEALSSFSENIFASAMTKNGGTATEGDYTLVNSMPAGAIIVAAKVAVIAGFAGDVSAAFSVTTSGGDNVITNLSVFATAVWGKDTTLDSASDGKWRVAAQTLNVTVVSATDFNLVKAGGGNLTVTFYYIQT